MKISVIIPVYNAEKFIRRAVESALAQPEVAEVVLIEDKSPDNSLQICQRIERKHKKVRLVRHYDGGNHGPSATRNLGIEISLFDYVAFLDADDYYLPNRFKIAKMCFDNYNDIDGVYEAIGIHFFSDKAKEIWLSSQVKELTTLTEVIDPRNLFEALLDGSKGSLHLDGLTVKRRVFSRCGYFIEHLRLHQDTAIFLQMAGSCNLISGQLDVPVAMRGIHGENRITAKYNRSKTVLLLWQALFHWACKMNLNKKRKILLLNRYVSSVFFLAMQSSRSFENDFGLLKESIVEFINHPYLSVHTGVYFAKKICDRLLDIH